MGSSVGAHEPNAHAAVLLPDGTARPFYSTIGREAQREISGEGNIGTDAQHRAAVANVSDGARE
jgi:hypothetical protein